MSNDSELARADSAIPSAKWGQWNLTAANAEFAREEESDDDRSSSDKVGGVEICAAVS